MAIFVTMMMMGLLLGFVGAGGSGFIISILTTFFGIPIHIALGTSLAAMVLTSLSGAFSHYREQNVVVPVGLPVGFFGMIGAFSGSRIAHIIPELQLTWFTASMLFLSAFLFWLRIFTPFGKMIATKYGNITPKGVKFWVSAAGLGIVTGMLSGMFGIGSSTFIQIGLLVFFGFSVRQSVGTTLFIILPIAFVGGFGYYTIGNLDVQLLVKVAAGTMIGSYLGAKCTNRLHPMILKIALVTVPTIGGLLLLIG
ncbi:MAG TPA: sulfite exporter TauE/SafE family protein [Bacillota bacterium]|nr:sulfite exporter TauE/SafE family protein [Bacillota bacterium]